MKRSSSFNRAGWCHRNSDSGRAYYQPLDSVMVIDSDLKPDDDAFNIIAGHEAVHTTHYWATQYGFARAQLWAAEVTYFKGIFEDAPDLKMLFQLFLRKNKVPTTRELYQLLLERGGPRLAHNLLVSRAAHLLGDLLDGKGLVHLPLILTWPAWEVLARPGHWLAYDSNSRTAEIDRIGRDTQPVLRSWYELMADLPTVPLLHMRRIFGRDKVSELAMAELLAPGVHPLAVRALEPIPIGQDKDSVFNLTIDHLTEGGAIGAETIGLGSLHLKNPSQFTYSDFRDALGDIGDMTQNPLYQVALGAYLHFVSDPARRSLHGFLAIIDLALNPPLCTSLTSAQDKPLPFPHDLLPAFRFLKCCDRAAKMDRFPDLDHTGQRQWVDELSARCGWLPLSTYATRARALRDQCRRSPQHRMVIERFNPMRRDGDRVGLTPFEFYFRKVQSGEVQLRTGCYAFNRFAAFVELFAVRDRDACAFLNGFTPRAVDAMNLDHVSPSLLAPGIIMTTKYEIIGTGECMPLAAHGMCGRAVNIILDSARLPVIDELREPLTWRFFPDEHIKQEIAFLAGADLLV